MTVPRALWPHALGVALTRPVHPPHTRPTRPTRCLQDHLRYSFGFYPVTVSVGLSGAMLAAIVLV